MSQVEAEHEFPDLVDTPEDEQADTPTAEADEPAAQPDGSGETQPQEGAETPDLGFELPRIVTEKYGGDVQKALEALEHQDALLGRQAQELGQQRAGEQPQQEAQGEPSDDQIYEALAELGPSQWQELFDEDPVRATELLTFRDTYPLQAELERMRQITNEFVAGQTVSALGALVGPDVLARNRDALTEAVERDPAFFDVEPELQRERLRMAAEAAEFRRQAQAASPASTSGVAAAGAPARVHTEGGSTPAPQAVRPTVDPEIAAIDEVGTARDAFGRLPL